MKNNNIEKLEIYDIDGCICKNVFLNIAKETNINQIKKEIIITEIDKYFIKYFNSVNSPVIKTIFLTGRQVKNYGKETYEQLSSLQSPINAQIVFFPDNFIFSMKTYYNFKITQILYYCLRYKEAIINVYDDHSAYFIRLNNLAKKMRILNLTTNLVSNLDYWKLKEENKGSE